MELQTAVMLLVITLWLCGCGAADYRVEINETPGIDSLEKGGALPKMDEGVGI